MKEFWQTCVSRLEQELPPQQISAWIRPLVPLAYDETQAVLRVAAPNRFKLDWVRLVRVAVPRSRAAYAGRSRACAAAGTNAPVRCSALRRRAAHAGRGTARPSRHDRGGAGGAGRRGPHRVRARAGARGPDVRDLRDG
ncbi:hypothetical protein G6F65_021428 [Rhizopus arrhizus]|nr:hypothetical protein G6F65_021428 [Rhizopus arrhizus]